MRDHSSSSNMSSEQTEVATVPDTVATTTTSSSPSPLMTNPTPCSGETVKTNGDVNSSKTPPQVPSTPPASGNGGDCETSTPQNGHSSPTNGLTNGGTITTPDLTTTMGSNFVPQGQGHYHAGPGGPRGGNSPSSVPRLSSNHRAHSPPSRYSPNSRGSSPPSQGGSNGSSSGGGLGAQNQQHVVLVHVNPGETFSVRVGDQIQHIQGPATVRMVSNNGPPLPMPMQVPPGHMVQQVVDENGILTHVILSPQPPGMAAPPMTVGYYGGPNSNAPQIYGSYPPQYAAPPYAHSQYPPHHHPHPGGAPGGPPPHMHPVPPTHIHGTPPPPTCNSHTHPHIHQGPATPHHNHSSHMDDRAQRQKQRLQNKLQQRHTKGADLYGYPNPAPTSPGRKKTKMANGSIDLRRSDPASSSSSVDGQEIEEERRIIRELLSKMQQPKVSEIESRSALIQLTPPDCNRHEFDIDPSEFKYELHLSDKGREGKYKLVYSGEATEIALKDLKPATEYHLRVCSLLDDLKGDTTEPLSFITQFCEPDLPAPPKFSNRTKTSLTLKWNSTPDNGSKISSYTLEYDQGRGDSNFVEIYNGLQRQFRVTKLSASTGYSFRLAANNSCGKSQYSEVVQYYTSGSVPSQPDPPMMSEQFVNGLRISWIKRPNDDAFTLQMEDDTTGHGFLTVYNGSELSYKIKNLRRNTEYKFRLSANNDEGSSKWSDTVPYRTLPDRPAAPPRPQVKGKIHSTSFRITWDPPRDTGGAEITLYQLELDDGRGFDPINEGMEKEYACDHLLPGNTYRVRVSCSGPGGKSDFSEVLSVTTQAVPPGPCQQAKLQGKPKATTLHLRWNYPDYDGGCPVSEFNVQLALPDGTTREVYKGQDLDCTVAGLSPGRPYIFQVRAVNRVGAGPWSEPLEVVSGAGVPDPPKTPSLACRSPHCAVVAWEEPVNNGATITEYRLEWQQRSETDFTQLYFGSSLNYELRGLTPATEYHFRVQALNSAGVGPFSPIVTCTTPPSSPGAVMAPRATATANSIHLLWKAPPSNGSDITSYNIDLGEKHQIPVGNVPEYTIDDLLPETTYKVRVQAVNAIGVGPFSSAVKVTTRPLPPQPPRLECVSCTHNSLKLKWGDGRNPDLIIYSLEMMRDNGSFHAVYHGASQTHKVQKLPELTSHEFRIYASNDAGDGPYSEIFRVSTAKAPPPACKSPKVSEVTLDGCVVEWPACRQLGSDTLIYLLQSQSVSAKDNEYKQVYRGTETQFHLAGLDAKTEYQVRVCAIRQCNDGSGDLMGAFSPGVTFTTTSPKPAVAVMSSPASLPSKITERKQLSDQQWAVILLLGFTIVAVFMAFLAQQIIAVAAPSNTGNATK